MKRINNIFYSLQGEGRNTGRAAIFIRFAGCKIVSPEFGWKSQDLSLEDTVLTAEYPFLDSRDLRLQNVELHGKYSFQYTENVTIENCNLDTKDAPTNFGNLLYHYLMTKGSGEEDDHMDTTVSGALFGLTRESNGSFLFMVVK